MFSEEALLALSCSLISGALHNNHLRVEGHVQFQLHLRVFTSQYEEFSCSLIGGKLRSQCDWGDNGIPEGMCSPRCLTSSKIWRVIHKPTLGFMVFGHDVTIYHHSWPRNSCTLCSRGNTVPGWFWVICIFNNEGGILYSRQGKGLRHERTEKHMPIHAFPCKSTLNWMWFHEQPPGGLRKYHLHLWVFMLVPLNSAATIEPVISRKYWLSGVPETRVTRTSSDYSSSTCHKLLVVWHFRFAWDKNTNGGET